MSGGDRRQPPYAASNSASVFLKDARPTRASIPTRQTDFTDVKSPLGANVYGAKRVTPPPETINRTFPHTSLLAEFSNERSRW